MIRDLAVMLADGGDCLSDLRAVRDQQPLFGPVASDTTAFRLIDRIAGEPAALEALRAARARARARAWELGARPERIVIDVDATLIGAHTEKEGAAVNFKGGFGFHPLLAYLDGSREALAGDAAPRQRAGAQRRRSDRGARAGARAAPARCRRRPWRPRSCCAPTRPARRSALCQAARDARISYLVGFDLTKQVRRAILALPEHAWRPALRQNGEERDGAQVAEITHMLDFYDWPEGSRVIVRRERPHPGAQLSFTDVDGHRFQATLTDLAGDAVELERLHRGRANAEDRVRAAKQTGLENLPFREFALNAVWLELSMIAQDLSVWTQALCLDGELAICEPKTLRYRLLHTAGRLAFHARRATLRLQASWPWASQLAAAFARLQALPPPAA